MRADYSDIFRQHSAVRKYDQVVYAPDSYASAVNRRQRGYLLRLAHRAFPTRRPVQHDFACGTGRAIRLLHGTVRAAYGYDTSTMMLDRARQSGIRARLLEIPDSGPAPEPVRTDGPTLVTVFRFLLNAPDELRDRAIAFAATALPDPAAGLLVVENHGNTRSARHLRHTRRSGNPWFNELSHAEVGRVLRRHGFTVVARRGFAIFPSGAYARPWLRWLARRIDDLTARLPVLSGVATTVLYVARRETAGEGG
jgi:SAM-dependent methyltransferase